MVVVGPLFGRDITVHAGLNFSMVPAVPVGQVLAQDRLTLDTSSSVVVYRLKIPASEREFDEKARLLRLGAGRLGLVWVR